MLRNRSVIRLLALAVAIVMVGTTVSEAQRKKQGGQRGQRGNRQGGNRFGGGGRTGGGLAILKNEYLQKELMFTAAQKKRVSEIDIQMAGSGALQREDVQKALNITTAQKEKMTSIQGSLREKMRGLFSRGDGGERPDFSKIREKMTEMREGINKEILTVLTSTQKAQFTRMKGKPVDLQKLRPTRQGGGGRPTERPDI